MLSLLGLVKYNNELVSLNKPSMLLLYLAHQNEWVSRDELAFLLKPDDDEKTAKNYVRVLLHRTKNIELAQNLELGQDKLRLSVATDTFHLKEAIDTKKIEAALDFYQGEFLHGFNAQSATEFETWVYTEREQYAQLFLDTLSQYLEGDSVNSEKAIGYIERAFELEPYEEHWQKSYYQYLLTSNQRLKAQTAFENFKSQLKEDLNVEISKSFEGSVKTLFDTVNTVNSGTSTKQENTDTLSIPAKKFLLPRAKTGFIGRQGELEKLSQYFLDNNFPLVTLIGLGGSGKTRLALEFAHNIKDVFEQVYFIDLSEAYSEQDFKNTLIATVNSLFLTSAQPWQTFKNSFDVKHSLIVLDNCEQLEGISEVLTELVEDCKNLSMLATSRKALNLSSEQLFDVTGLELPPIDTSASELKNFSASELFIMRVEQVQQDYDWTEVALQSVIKICHLTDGLPLALELSAAWARLLTVAEIESELGSSLDLLEAQQSDISVRHQSVKAVFANTFARLSKQEQDTLLALSLFQGGWELKAAKTITGAHLPILINLRNKALLRRDSSSRFSMHMLLKQFLQEIAVKHKTYSIWQEKHAQFYLETIEELNGDKLITGISNDFENLKTAWFHRLKHDAYSLTTTLRKLNIFIETTGRSLEGQNLLKDSILIIEKLFKPSLSELCLLTCFYAELAYLQIEQGRVEESKVNVEKVWKNLPTEKVYLAERADCLMKLSYIYNREGSTEKRVEAAELALKDLEEINSSERAICLRHLAGAYYALGEIEKAKIYYKESIELLEKFQDDIEDGKRQLGISLLNYGLLHHGHIQNENFETFDKALSLYKKAMRVFEKVGFLKGLSVAHNNLAAIYLQQVELDAARYHLTEALRISQKTGNINIEVYCYVGFAKLLIEGNTLKSADTLKETLSFMSKARSLALKNNLNVWPLIVMHYAQIYYHLGNKAKASEIYSALNADADTSLQTKEALRKVEKDLDIELYSEGLPLLEDLIPQLGVNLETMLVDNSL